MKSHLEIKEIIEAAFPGSTWDAIELRSVTYLSEGLVVIYTSDGVHHVAYIEAHGKMLTWDREVY